MNRNLIIELAEMLVGFFVMGICAAMMFCGIDSEVKAVFIMGATLAVRSGFSVASSMKYEGSKKDTKKKRG